MLTVEQLHFAYPNRSVLNGISFGVEQGELICLLGENGAGKTTLIKCIMGFLRGYDGGIAIGGTSLKQLSAKQLAQQIAYIPQAHESVYNYTAMELVLMGTTSHLSLFHSPGEQEKAQARSALETMGVAHLAERGYSQLSGGEQQLVFIARALAQKSKLLLMDEPTANLDYGNQLYVMEQVKKLTDQGYTVFVSTHNPAHALRFASRVLVLDRGEVLRFGVPEDVLTKDILDTIYGVSAEIVTADTTWGQRKWIVPQ